VDKEGKSWGRLQCFACVHHRYKSLYCCVSAVCVRRVEYNFINKSSLFKLIGHSLVVKSSSYVDIIFLVRSILPSMSGSSNLSTDLNLYDWKDLGLLSRVLSRGKCGKNSEKMR
jgi:hypothetical protein